MIAAIAIVAASNASLPSALKAAAAWLGAVTGILGFVGQVITWASAEPASRADSVRSQAEAAARSLGGLALRRWRDEVNMRQLDDPAPARVRWRLAERIVMDHPGTVFGQRGGLLPNRARLEGAADDIRKLAVSFRGLPRRRLVITGQPGAGKTTIAVLLLRELLEHPAPGEPVPLLFTLSGWNPGRDSFRAWLARRVRADYPQAVTEEVARRLVDDRMILPILDGVDEVPLGVRADMVRAWNEVASDPLILTCRAAEFRDVVTDADGDVLTAAAVIGLEPLTPHDTSDYLQKCLSPGRLRSPGWQRVLSHLRRGESGPLARALTNPLALWMFRAIYITSGEDPAVVIDPARFADAAAIRDHLLDELVPAVLAARRNDHPAGVRAPSRHRNPAGYRRSLAFLARGLSQSGTRDIAWWRFGRVLMPPPLLRRVTGGVTVLAVAAVPGIAAARIGASAIPASNVILVAAYWLLMVALAVLAACQADRAPLYVDWAAFRRYLVRIMLAAASLFVIGDAVFTSVNRYAADTSPPALYILLATVSAASLFALFGAVILFTYKIRSALKHPRYLVSGDGPATPRSSVNGDLAAQVLRVFGIDVVLPAMLLSGLPCLIVFSSLDDGPIALSFFGMCLIFWVPSAASFYLITRLALFLSGHLPWRLMPFLEDAHRLGFLRQVGPVYQFRHAELQDRLAAPPPGPRPRRPSS